MPDIVTSENPTRSRCRPGKGPRRHRALATSSLLAVLAVASAWLFVPGVQAYVGQASQLIQLTAPSQTVPCSNVVTVKATVTDAKTNERVSGQSVHWSIKSSPSSRDAVTPDLTATDGSGRTSAQVTFGQVSGARRIQVYSADKKFAKFITLSCQADIVTPPPVVTPRPTPHPTPTTPTSTDPGTTDPTPTPSTGPDQSPAATPEPGQSAQPIQPQPTDPLATPVTNTVGVGGGSPAPPTTTALGNPGTTPGPGIATQPTTTPQGDDGPPPVLMLIIGLGMLGVVALLLWFVLRRRSSRGQPSA